MNSRSNQPHANAHIDELQAWAAKSKAAAPVAAKPGASTAQEASTLASVPGPARESSGTALAPVSRQRGLGKVRDSQPTSYAGAGASTGSAAEAGTRGTLLPKILIGLGIGVAAYLVISVIIGLLMTMLMILGGVAAIYGAYRVGRWQGRRETR